jgi:hypothetical protein
MAHTVVLTDVPKNKVDQVVKDYEDAGATVSVTPQPNGKYTVTAVFPNELSIDNLAKLPGGMVRHAMVSWRAPKD